MASLGLLGGLAGLGRGMQDTGKALNEDAKIKYLEARRQDEKADDRAYQAEQTASNREFQKELVQDNRTYQAEQKGAEWSREDAQRAAKVEVKDGIQYSYNSEGELIKQEPVQPSSKRQYLDPVTDSRIKGIDNEIAAILKSQYPEDQQDRLAELRAEREARLSGKDYEPPKGQKGHTPEQLAAADDYAKRRVKEQAGWFSSDSSDFSDFEGDRTKAYDNYRREYLNDLSGGLLQAAPSSPEKSERGHGAVSGEDKIFQQVRANPKNANYTDEQLRAAIRQKMSAR